MLEVFVICMVSKNLTHLTWMHINHSYKFWLFRTLGQDIISYTCAHVTIKFWSSFFIYYLFLIVLVMLSLYAEVLFCVHFHVGNWFCIYIYIYIFFFFFSYFCQYIPTGLTWLGLSTNHEFLKTKVSFFLTSAWYSCAIVNRSTI